MKDAAGGDALQGTVARSGEVLLLTLEGREDPAQSDVPEEESNR